MTAPSEPPSAFGVAAGIADADRVGASAKAQAASPIIKSRFILVFPPFEFELSRQTRKFRSLAEFLSVTLGTAQLVLRRIISSVLQCWLNGTFRDRSGFTSYATVLMELIGERVFCQRQNRLHDEAALCLSKTNVRMSRMIVLIANAHSKSPQLT